MNPYLSMVVTFIISVIITFFLKINFFLNGDKYHHINKLYMAMYFSMWAILVNYAYITITFKYYNITHFVVLIVLTLLLLIIRQAIISQTFVSESNLIKFLIEQKSSQNNMLKNTNNNLLLKIKKENKNDIIQLKKYL